MTEDKKGELLAMATVPEIFVIIREIGEYSDRDWQAIRYALSEDEAKAAVQRLDLEGRTQYGKRPVYPKRLPTHGYFDDAGVEWDWTMSDRRPHNVEHRKRDNHDERVAINDAALTRYNEEVAAMGCLDPEGPQKEATYSYSRVTATPPVESRP